ncbi:helix-turn-helix domain-containing protein [Streptomyces xiamenensis]|uniref:helix-turn-helix domain-containing protein n=1 Tax=Streptomyces xiamenensis TaxID=408015 RepID=UPI0035D72DB2
MVVDEHVQCRQKGVQARSHTQANGRPSPWSRPAQTSDSLIEASARRNRLRNGGCVSGQLGPLLSRLRQHSGMTQEQLAERSDGSVSTIRRLKNGRSADHRLGTVNLLADALEAGPEDRRALAETPGGTHHVPKNPAPEPAPAPPPAVRAPARGSTLAEAVDALATDASRRLRREEAQRRAHDPSPLPVRWRAAPAHLPESAARTESAAPRSPWVPPAPRCRALRGQGSDAGEAPWRAKPSSARSSIWLDPMWPSAPAPSPGPSGNP